LKIKRPEYTRWYLRRILANTDLHKSRIKKIYLREMERITSMGVHSDKSINLLFICSRNQWRSPTGERVWSNRPDINVRSAGTSPKARRTISVDDIKWADILLFMEEKHKSRVCADFARLVHNKSMHVLDIPDEYRFMDSELVNLLEIAVSALVGHG